MLARSAASRTSSAFTAVTAAAAAINEALGQAASACQQGRDADTSTKRVDDDAPAAQSSAGGQQQLKHAHHGLEPYRNSQAWQQEIEDNSILIEPDIPVYDLQTVMQQVGIPVEPSTPILDDLLDICYIQASGIGPEEAVEIYGATEEELPPYPGAKKILHWQSRMVLEAGPLSFQHGLNSKAKCWFYLRELQEEYRLSEQALQLIARICGPRFNPNKGLVTLTCNTYAAREDNRREVLQIVMDLVSEGHTEYPNAELEHDQQLSAHSA